MKYLKILIVSVFLLNITQSNASEICTSSELLETMSEDPQVIELLDNSFIINMVKKGGINNIPEAHVDDYKSLLIQQTELKKIINEKYLVFSSMSRSERTNILTTLYDLGISDAASDFWVCAGTFTAPLAAHFYYTGESRWKEVEFTTCIAGAVIADSALEAESVGSNTPFVELEFEEEVQTCKKWVYDDTWTNGDKVAVVGWFTGVAGCAYTYFKNN